MLVIFDINSTVADTTFKRRPGCQEDFKVRSKYVYKRPHLDELLDYLYDRGHQVGVWTSCISQNAKGIVDVLFEGRRLEFVLSRDSCDLVPGPGYKTVKDLRKVWSMKNEREWGPENTVIIEDSPDKISLQPRNLMLVSEYLACGGEEDRELLRIKDVLDRAC